MISYQYRKSHCGDKTVVRSSYLHNGISYTGKMTSLYWIRVLKAIGAFPSDNELLEITRKYIRWSWWNTLTGLCHHDCCRCPGAKHNIWRQIISNHHADSTMTVLSCHVLWHWSYCSRLKRSGPVTSILWVSLLLVGSPFHIYNVLWDATAQNSICNTLLLMETMCIKYGWNPLHRSKVMDCTRKCCVYGSSQAMDLSHYLCKIKFWEFPKIY